MKKINLVLQSKGGVGKSLFLWFVAQHDKEKSTTFIDLDESTKTSSLRLADVVGEKRIKHFKILNENKKLEREKILDLFEALSKAKSENIYIDFGAPESEEFKKLLENDITAIDLQNELQTMGVELSAYVVIAGRDALASCVNYFNAIDTLVSGSFPVTALLNEGTFGGIESVETGKEALTQKGIIFKSFGNLGDSEGGRTVIATIGSGSDVSALPFSARMAYKKALGQIQEILTAAQ